MKSLIPLLFFLTVFSTASNSHAGIWTMFIGGTEEMSSGANDIANNAIVMSFDDSFGPNKVRLTIDFQSGSDGVDDGAFLNDLAFNIDGITSGVTFEYVSGVSANGETFFSSNSESLSPASGFDVLFDFPPPPTDHSKQKFYVGMTSTYDIVGTGLLSTSFNAFNEADEFRGFVHINAVDNGDSGKYGDTTSFITQSVPEPTTLTIWATLLVGLFFVRSRRR